MYYIRRSRLVKRYGSRNFGIGDIDLHRLGLIPALGCGGDRNRTGLNRLYDPCG